MSTESEFVRPTSSPLLRRSAETAAREWTACFLLTGQERESFVADYVSHVLSPANGFDHVCAPAEYAAEASFPHLTGLKVAC